MEKVKVTKDAAGEFRWMRYAANGEELSASTEGYKDKGYATEQAIDKNADCEIVDATGDDEVTVYVPGD